MKYKGENNPQLAGKTWGNDEDPQCPSITIKIHPLIFLETPTISVVLDFLKCVKIFIFFKTQICTESVSRFSRHYTDMRYWRENLYTLSVQICVLKKMKILTHLSKSWRIEIVESFQLWCCDIDLSKLVSNLTDLADWIF